MINRSDVEIVKGNGLFSSYFISKGLEYYLRPPKFQKMCPVNTHKVYSILNKAMADGLKIGLVPDCDFDGLASPKAWDLAFKKLKYYNYVVDTLKARIHTVQAETLFSLYERGCRVIMLLDSSSNSLPMIKEVLEKCEDLQIIIIDHHETSNTYKSFPDRCTIVNPKLDKNSPLATLSAGMLNAMVADYVLFRKGLKDNTELYVGGYASMYSDVCPCGNPFIVDLMRSMQGLSKVPDYIQLFFDNYNKGLSSNFISFKVAPIINAAIRMERFEILDKLFFHFEDIRDHGGFLRELQQIKKDADDLVAAAMEMILGEMRNGGTPKHYIRSKNLIVVFLPNENLKNFAGYIAGKIANLFNNICICVRPTDFGYSGSVRDFYGRDVKSAIDGTVKKAEGHGPAFGIELYDGQVESTCTLLDNIDLPKPIKYYDFKYEELLSNTELREMALYNELAVSDLPKARVSFTVDASFVLSNTGKRKTAKIKDLVLVSFDQKILRGTTVKAVPVFNNGNVECKLEE